MIDKYYKLAKKTLFPLHRSLTGEGTKKTLKYLKREFPKLTIKKIKSRSKIFDWKIPDEWKIKDAYVLDKNNNKIVDYKKNNLHVIGYSRPLNKTVSKNVFFSHLHSLPNRPHAIPYITSYYKRNWGFCVTDKQKKNFNIRYNHNDKFKIKIDSSFNPKGYLNYAELLIKGKSRKEILISSYICHPSMANNELSGIIVAMSLINYFQKKKLNISIRFLFVPETIGSITFISKNLNHIKNNILCGYQLTCIGDERNYSFIQSKDKSSLADKALIKAFKQLKIKAKEYSFLHRGSDERQFNSPGIDMPMTVISKSIFGTYPEYHTSDDNFDIVTLKGITDGFRVVKKSINNLQKLILPKSLILCEPMLSKRNMYPHISKHSNKNKNRIYLDFLQFSNGKNDLEEIAYKIKKSFQETKKIYNFLKGKLLIE